MHALETITVQRTNQNCRKSIYPHLQTHKSSGHFQEALTLAAHARDQPRVFRTCRAEANGTYPLLGQLLATVRIPGKLSVSFCAIRFLRQMGVFPEREHVLTGFYQLPRSTPHCISTCRV